MTQTRRHFLATAAAATGVITILPFRLQAAAHGGDMFETGEGPVTVHPVHHASIVLETPKGVIYVDPVGEASEYEGFPAADLVLVTHEHGDHYNEAVLTAVAGSAPILTNPAVYDMLPEALKGQAMKLANGETHDWDGTVIDAIPAYNTTEERKNFHPQGRDNGYVLTMGDFRIYISGDTEGTPEMMALKDIDLAFVSMNLPFTMDAESAAQAVKAFAPTYVYPYHYRGRDGGTQDPAAFAEMVGDASKVQMGDWYKPGELG